MKLSKLNKYVKVGMKFITDVDYRFYTYAKLGKYNDMPDEEYTKRMYKANLGKSLNLENPTTFNEKLQYLKLYDHNPKYIKMVDKFEAKKFIAETVGEQFVVPTLGVWNRFEDIEFDKLPSSFVLKCTHDSGGIIICKDKRKLDIKSVRKKIKKHLNKNYYYLWREWPYKEVPPRIIAEPYMVDESGVELKDYKVFCFNGKAEYVEVDFNRFIEHKLNPYDFDWTPLHFCDKSPNDYDANIPKPRRLEDMRRLSELLSKGIDFLRVDFYSINDLIYVGELTFYPGSGVIDFNPPEMDLYYGNKLRITIKKEDFQ